MPKAGKYRILLFLIFYALILYPFLNAQVTFIVESLPEATPVSDTIFIVGTFNEWKVNDPGYMLKRQLNGKFAITLSITGTHEYKFTRGSWMKVETGTDNEYIPNRTFTENEGKRIYVRIRNWQDLGGARKIPYIVFYFFAVSFQGLVLLLLGSRIQKKSPFRSRLFYFFNTLVIILFLGIVAYFIINPIWKNYILLTGHIFAFVWGPATYIFLRAFYSEQDQSKIWVHFIPTLIICLLVFISLSNVSSLSFQDSFDLDALLFNDYLLVGIGLLYSFIYILRSFSRNEIKSILKNRKSPRYSFMQWFMLINIFSLLLLLLGLIARMTDLVNWDLSILFILYSSIVILETFYLWKSPEILREEINFQINEAEKILERLDNLMNLEKVYKDPELNISRLSKLMDTKNHILSRILNDHFGKNFRDYINEYRVKEFIHSANEGNLERYTFLGLAHEVGFNSKSTFNLAFKKFTGQNPRDFFKSKIPE